MADDRPAESRPSWRSGSRPSATPNRSGPGHSWTQRTIRSEAAGTGRRSRALLIGVTAGALLACLAAIVVLVVLFSPPKSVAVVLVGSNYATNLAVPHNALGWQGLKRIEELARTRQRWALFRPPALHLIRPARPLEYAKDWGDLIAELAKAGVREDTILFVVSLHGGADTRGGYLLPGQTATPDDRLPIAEVIGSLGKLFPEKSKVLVLEGAQLPADWRQGLLTNSFGRRLAEQEDAIRAGRNLWVLSGCDVDQRCWSSEGLGRTVFLHYLAEGLRGQAAGADGLLDLDQLHRYVRKNVADWAWAARGAIQEPVLLPGSGASGEGTGVRAGRPSRPLPLAVASGAGAPRAPAPFDRGRTTEAWQHYRDLDRLVPNPSVYSPRRWREYRAALVRFEELSRAGAVEEASGLTGRLASLEQKIDGDRFLRLAGGSVENSFVAGVVQGTAAAPQSSPQPEFGPFWNAPGPLEASSEWKKLQSVLVPKWDGDGGPESSPRLRVDAILLKLASAEPSKNLRRAADRLDTTRAAGDVQPAEAHFARMLCLFLEKRAEPRTSPAFWKVVTQVLEARVEAEGAALGLAIAPGGYHYAEQIHPWVRPALESADALRSRGEDLLFSSETQAWEQADAVIRQARSQYETALKTAASARSAMAARDRAFSELPGYSRWIARRHADELEDKLSDAVEALWASGFDLAETLEAPGDRSLASLDSVTAKLVTGLDDLFRRFADQASRVTGDRHEDWQAATAAASVPFGDTDTLTLRAGLWDRLDSIRESDYARFEKPEPSQPSADRKSDARERLWRQARVQGRMALASLGRRWFEDREAFSSAEAGDFNGTSERARHPLPSEASEIDAWVKDLTLAGERVGRRWRQMDAEITRLVGDPGEIPEDLRAYQSALVKAERLARLIDGGAPALPDKDAEAAGWYRKSRVHDLLLWLAERTYRGHWYDEDPRGQKPYYQVAGSRCVDDAQALFPKSARVRQVRELLEKPGLLRLDAPTPPVLTSERSIDATFRVAKSGDLPDGLPVVRPVAGRLVRLPDDGGGYRIVTPVPDGSAVRFTLAGPAQAEAGFDPKVSRPRVEATEFGAELYFRGEVRASRTGVEIHPMPEVVAVGPPPPDPPQPSLAVRADNEVIHRFGEGTGALAIVLDCSGSMIPSVNTFEQFRELKDSKFHDAKRALDGVLAQLPEGTTLSLWVFGQAREGFANVYAATAEDSRQAQDPKSTIRQLRTPTRWRRDQREPLMRQIEGLWPFHGTPLIQAMTRARDDLTRATGLKTLLVLTDGNDSEFAKGELAIPTPESTGPDPRKDRIHKFLREQLSGRGIVVNTVFFRVEKNEFVNAAANFGVLRTFDPPGRDFRAENLPELKQALAHSIRQRLVWDMVRPTEATPLGAEALEVTAPGSSDQWWPRPLVPGRYRLRVRADQTYSCDVELARGDRLLVRLTDENGRLVFQRGLYSEDIPAAKSREAGGVRLSVLAEARLADPGSGMQLLVGLEALNDPGNRLEQVRPRFVWFELSVKDLGDPPGFAVRWRERPFYPAPVWQIETPEWVADPAGAGPAQPILSAWWDSEQGTTPNARLDLTRFAAPEAVDHEEVRLADGKTVVVEGVRLEDHRVEHRWGEEPSTEHCLVVRVDYRNEGGPVIIDPDGLREALGTVGYEQRIYSRARKSAGLFWPVTHDQLAKLKGLGLISLPRARAKAAARQNVINLDPLPRPETGARLPAPPEVVTLPN